jgi:hypothetical protein
MAGVPAVITFNNTYGRKDQAAALMIQCQPGNGGYSANKLEMLLNRGNGSVRELESADQRLRT